MYSEKENYQKSIWILKRNISRITAATIFLFSIILFIIIAVLFFSDYFQSINQILHPIPTLITILTGIGIILVVLPLELGIKYWFYMISFNEKIPLSDIFHYFSAKELYLKAVIYRTIILLKHLATYIIYLIPAAGIHLLSVMIGKDTNTNIYLLIVWIKILFLLIGLFFAFYHNLQYQCIWCLFFQNPNYRLSQLCQLSKMLMKPKRQEFIKIYLATTPFICFGIFLFPLILLVSYFYVITSVKVIEVICTQLS